VAGSVAVAALRGHRRAEFAVCLLLVVVVACSGSRPAANTQGRAPSSTVSGIATSELPPPPTTTVAERGRCSAEAQLGPDVAVASARLGAIDFPLRLVVPFAVSIAMVVGIQIFLARTFFGRAVLGVAQDQLALRLMAIDPVRVKELAFALSIATAGVAGAFLIVIQPVQPSIGREYIGLVFAVCVLGGLGSIWGTLLGAFILGLAESFTSTFFGPSWAPAVSFGLLLAALAFRPSGLLGR